MRALSRLTLIAAIIFPAAAFAQTKPALDANSPTWWLQQAMAEIPKLKTAETQFAAYRDLLYPASKNGAPEIVSQITAELDKLMAANPAFKLNNIDPKSSLTRAKIIEQTLKGNHEAALAQMKKEGGATFDEIARALAIAGNLDQLRAIAKDGSLDKTQTAVCWNYLYDEAIAQNDFKTAKEILYRDGIAKTMPAAILGSIHGTMHMDGTFEAQKAILLGKLLPEIDESGQAYSTLARMLARQGYTRDAVTFALRVPEKGDRGGAIYEACRALATEGKSDEALSIIEKETKKEIIANGYHGLAVGLALHGELDAARDVFKKANRAANDPEFIVALALGPVVKSGGKTGLDEFKTAGDVHQKILIVQDTVRNLIGRNKLEVAAALSAAYPGTNASSLQSRGHLLFYVVLAYRAAKNETGVKQTIAAIDDLLKLADEKEKPQAIQHLAFAHGYLGDGEGALAIIATHPDAKERDSLRKMIAGNLAAAGDIKGAAKLLASMEIPPEQEALNSVAFNGIRSGHLPELGAWIQTWPNAETRFRSYFRISQDVAEMTYFRRLGRVFLF